MATIRTCDECGKRLLDGQGVNAESYDTGNVKVLVYFRKRLFSDKPAELCDTCKRKLIKAYR